MNAAVTWIHMRAGELEIRSTTARYRAALVCSVCLRGIKTAIGAALCWQVSPHDRMPHSLGVLCSDRCEERLGGSVSSLELRHFAKPRSAGARLRHLLADFPWTQRQRERIDGVAAAVRELEAPRACRAGLNSRRGNKPEGAGVSGAVKNRGKQIVDGPE